MGMSNVEAVLRVAELKSKFPELYQEHVRKGTHIVHIAFDLINHDVQLNGVRWNKCLDCGTTYKVNSEAKYESGQFCSEACEIATVKYMNGGL